MNESARIEYRTIIYSHTHDGAGSCKNEWLMPADQFTDGATGYLERDQALNKMAEAGWRLIASAGSPTYPGSHILTHTFARPLAQS